MAMGSQPQLHIFFLPFLAKGHIYPMLETVRHFANRGVGCTIISTAANASYIRPIFNNIDNVDVLSIPFPSTAVNLPAGIECTDVLPSGPDNVIKFITGINLLQDDFKKLAVELEPDCIICDHLYFWPVQVAASLNIPIFHYQVNPIFAKCVMETIFNSNAHLSSPESTVIGPLTGLPHPIQLTRTELPPELKWPGYFEAARAAQEKINGIIFTSFEEVTPDYVEHCRKTTAPAKIFCVGPVHLRSNASNWEANNSIKKWLDTKPSESVLYISFGSDCKYLSDEQLREIALGLASCDSYFIWVVRGGSGKMEDWLPEEFHAAVQAGKGLMITEWGPQIAILNHPATGGFLMQGGWNSVSEAVCGGLPVISWPMHSEQFINERLMVDVMGIGLRILEEEGDVRTTEIEGKSLVTATRIKTAVNRLMREGGDHEKTIRATARKYGEMGRLAMEEGGSSYNNINMIIEEISSLVKGKGNN